MNWSEATGKYHAQTLPHNCQLTSLPETWQRELAALWRLETAVNNGAYLQFVVNWGKETYVDASRALRKIGAHQMADLVDRCQALVDEHFDTEGATDEQRMLLIPNPVIGRDGKRTPRGVSPLPDAVIERIHELSYEFMGYPDDLATLGLNFYRPYLASDL